MHSATTLGLLLVLLLSSSPTTRFFTALAILDPMDYLALQAIRKSLADLPGSSFLASWDFTDDPCAFPGVLCAGNRVVALALGDPRASAPGLAGRLDPLAFARLSALAELSLVPGRVAGTLPQALPSGLRFLALSGNLLSGPLPASLHHLLRLRTLDLSGNRLSGPIPSPLLRLPRLTNLVLAHNRLSGQIPPASAPLIRLDLKHNLLTGSVPALPQTLTYLAISANALTGRVDRVLPRLLRLNHLDLSMNRLSGPIPGRIFAFHISNLQLQRNAFSGDLRPAGALSPAVERVDLSHNRLGGRVPAALAEAEVVYLNNNRFTGQVPADFGERVKTGGIRLLYLQHNFLTGMIGIGPGTVPAGTTLCLHYNCMVPPQGTACPLRAGRKRTRPAAQCPRWKKG